MGRGRRGGGITRHRESLGFVVFLGVLRFRWEHMVIMIYGDNDFWYFFTIKDRRLIMIL